MAIHDVVAAIMFLGVIAYGVFGGADFGSGIWDLTAGNETKGGAFRSLIDHSIGPVWEANHVWLIFVFVFLWSGFPVPFAALSTTLAVPLTFAAFGIVLRGSAFAFRKMAPSIIQAKVFGFVFAVSSVVTPFFLGAIAGAVASGRVRLDGTGSAWTTWTGPTSLIGGGLSVLTCAFLAATFLAAEAERIGDAVLVAQCRRRALGSGLLTGAFAIVAILPLEHDAPVLFHGLTHRAAPLIGVSAIGGVAALWLLRTGKAQLARIGAVVAVAAVIAGWGAAQYPWVLVGQIKLADAAGARPTLIGLVVVFGLAAVTVVPSLIWLFRSTQNEPPNHRQPSGQTLKHKP